MNRLIVFSGFIIFAILIMILVFNISTKGDHAYIRDWAKQNNYSVVQIDYVLFNNGPFWYRGKGQRVYKVVLSDNDQNQKISYFRSGLWGYDQEWEK